MHICPGPLQEERHPSAMGIGSSKEGFSAFGLLNRCVSPAGKRLLRLWFLRPIISLPVIRDRQVSSKSRMITYLDCVVFARTHCVPRNCQHLSTMGQTYMPVRT